MARAMYWLTELSCSVLVNWGTIVEDMNGIEEEELQGLPGDEGDPLIDEELTQLFAHILETFLATLTVSTLMIQI